MRRLLKRGFVPVLFLLSSAWVIYSLGLFDRIADFYATRGTQETGRFVVWPLAFERFLGSPFVGVGAANISTAIWTSDHPIEPHNGLLHVALASGIGPLIFFVAFGCVRLSAFAKEATPAGSAFFRATGRLLAAGDVDRECDVHVLLDDGKSCDAAGGRRVSFQARPSGTAGCPAGHVPAFRVGDDAVTDRWED